ncbi:MAG TPA: molybdopterin-binding protein, partial [bacterium]|nr:molybdopterin-binding protein [bacterium]
IAAAVDAALGAHDLVVTTGGASVGDFDHLPRTMQHLGLEIHFDRLQMKPGKPVHCAMRGPAMLLALPGSPLAAFTAARLLAVAACRTLLGHPEPAGPWLTARLTLPLPHKPGRTRYVPVTLASDPDTGTARAHPVLTHSVSDMVAAGRADGMLEVPAEWPDVPGGAVLPCLLWRRWPR